MLCTYMHRLQLTSREVALSDILIAIRGHIIRFGETVFHLPKCFMDFVLSKPCSSTRLSIHSHFDGLHLHIVKLKRRHSLFLFINVY